MRDGVVEAAPFDRLRRPKGAHTQENGSKSMGGYLCPAFQPIS